MGTAKTLLYPKVAAPIGEFMDVLASARINPSCDNDREKGRQNLLEDWLYGMKERAQDRRDRRARGNDKVPAAENIFQNEGGIESLAKPRGFDKKTEDNDFGKYIEYSDGKSKVCYWKREDYQPSADSAKKMQELLKKGPHSIMARDPRNPHVEIAASQDEVDAAYDCLNPGRWSKGGPFEVNSIAVKTVNGKNVLSVDVEFQNGKRSTVTIFNPDANSNTLEHVWVESNKNADAAKLNATVLAGLKWKKEK
jgi:hypothetical protein